MIRDRRDEDLDRLVEVLGELNDRAGVIVVEGPRDWLQELDAERSWVFDQAPVSVAPTKNVVGHVQIYRSPDATWLSQVAVQTSQRVDDLLVIGRLFVKPVRHHDGIARYLLRESVKYVEARGCQPVLDPQDLSFVPPSLCAKLRFRELPIDDDVRSVMARAYGVTGQPR